MGMLRKAAVPVAVLCILFCVVTLRTTGQNDTVVTNPHGTQTTLVSTSGMQTLFNKTLTVAPTSPAGPSGNSVTLLNFQTSLTAVPGMTGTYVPVYQFTVLANTLGVGKCINATVAFQHTSGTDPISYEWTFGTGLTTTFFSSSSAQVGTSKVHICNTATNAQTWFQEPPIFNVVISSGMTNTNGTTGTTAMANLEFQFNEGSVGPDSVTPLFFEVELAQ